MKQRKMVGFSQSSESLHVKDYLIAGAGSGFITRCLFQPLDVLKIRLQLQVEPLAHASNASKYKGISHAVECILKEEGIRAFWKGLVPAQCLSKTYGALQFLSFELLSKRAWIWLPPDTSHKLMPLINFTCGMSAGCIATIGSFPFDVIRTRLVGQSAPKVYKGMVHGLKMMVSCEGPRSLYKGLLPTLIQVAPNAGAQFAFYKLFEEMWDMAFDRGSAKPSAIEILICGAGAGIGAKTVVYPLDLIKKRIQIVGFEVARKPFGVVRQYYSLLHCIRTILRDEGMLGMYKGLSPSILKAACTTASHFFLYEEICRLLVHVHEK